MSVYWFDKNSKTSSLISSLVYIVLDSLTTDPEYQRRGAATLLLKWGIDLADKLNGEVNTGTPKIITHADATNW